MTLPGQGTSGLYGGLAQAARTLVLLPVLLWRLLAPLRAPRCRYYPSCSGYAVAAVRSHGVLRGGVLAARRVGRCHPWQLGGIDPVPDVAQRTAWRRPWRGVQPLTH